MAPMSIRTRARSDAAEFAARWLLGREVAARTAERTMSLLRTHLVSRWGRVQLGQIDYMSVQEWVVESGTKMAPPIVSKCYGLLKAILDTAAPARVLPFNAAEGVKVRREARDTPRVLFGYHPTRILRPTTPRRTGPASGHRLSCRRSRHALG
jgi:hypothetical protein